MLFSYNITKCIKWLTTFAQSYLLPWHAWKRKVFGFPQRNGQCSPSNWWIISESMLRYPPSLVCMRPLLPWLRRTKTKASDDLCSLFWASSFICTFSVCERIKEKWIKDARKVRGNNKTFKLFPFSLSREGFKDAHLWFKPYCHMKMVLFICQWIIMPLITLYISLTVRYDKMAIDIR